MDNVALGNYVGKLYIMIVAPNEPVEMGGLRVDDLYEAVKIGLNQEEFSSMNLPHRDLYQRAAVVLYSAQDTLIQLYETNGHWENDFPTIMSVSFIVDDEENNKFFSIDIVPALLDNNESYYGEEGEQDG